MHHHHHHEDFGQNNFNGGGPWNDIAQQQWNPQSQWMQNQQGMNGAPGSLDFGGQNIYGGGGGGNAENQFINQQFQSIDQELNTLTSDMTQMNGSGAAQPAEAPQQSSSSGGGGILGTIGSIASSVLPFLSFL